jgi:predicted component of type VI protein secretion system
MEKNAYLVASKFVHFTKCCLREHIQANDIGANLKMNINTLVAKYT